MLTNDVLQEVLTLNEAAQLSAGLGWALDQDNLSRYARSGQIAARKSDSAWLTTRTALAQLLASLKTERQGRLHIRFNSDSLTPEICAMLKEINQTRAHLETRITPEQKKRLWDEMLPEAIYHTNRIEGNRLSLEQVRAILAEEQVSG